MWGGTLPCQPKIEAIGENLQSPAPQPNDDDDDDDDDDGGTLTWAADAILSLTRLKFAILVQNSHKKGSFGVNKFNFFGYFNSKWPIYTGIEKMYGFLYVRCLVPELRAKM